MRYGLNVLHTWFHPIDTILRWVLLFSSLQREKPRDEVNRSDCSDRKGWTLTQMRGFLIQMREEKRKWSRRQGGREGVPRTESRRIPSLTKLAEKRSSKGVHEGVVTPGKKKQTRKALLV